MSHRRTTNILLFVIALCLVALTAKQFAIYLIPSARAEGSIGNTRIIGCYYRFDQCIDRQVRVNGVERSETHLRFFHSGN